MRLQISLSLSLILATTSVARNCGNTQEPIELIEQAIRFNSHNRQTAGQSGGASIGRPNHESSKTSTPRTQEVNLYMHNIYINETAAGAYISEEDLTKQWRVMNENYASTGISFVLKNITHTQNKSWALAIRNGTTELKMKQTLRMGGYEDLNLYFRVLGRGFFGDFAPNSEGFWQDGCDILHTTIPGGPQVNYNEGKTATHETGHWLGLLHPFSGGCRGGDYIDDTPAEETASYGCPVGKDTCRGDMFPGLDPIHNFMDYAYE
ncbi:Ulilysin [Drechslerella dactyloides]|uniref:Ulilysin n=1 Tax=Drechslerella dactyloides TaxID=74499 RepID=A0AAD6J183_DREDA|nr:Ulilysin [Drechslerella dactyloides]